MITIKQIVKRAKEIGYHYFDADALKFFGQKLSDFRIKEIKGRVFLYAPAGKQWEGEYWSFGEYNKRTGRIDPVDVKISSINDIYGFFNSL